jgi:hypothetical protein
MFIEYVDSNRSYDDGVPGQKDVEEKYWVAQ